MGGGRRNLVALVGALAAFLFTGCAGSNALPPVTGSGGIAGTGGVGAGGTGLAGGTSGGGTTGASGSAGEAGASGGGTTGGGGATGGTAAAGTTGGGGRGGSAGAAGAAGGGGSGGGEAGRGGAGGGGRGGSGAAGTGGGSGGTTGAGGAGGWSLGGASRCAGAAYVACEDFESTAVNATPAGDWSLPATNYGTGTVAVAADFAARGAHALKITIPSGSTSVERYLQRKNLGALASGHFGRLFFRVQGPTTTAFVHWDMILGAGSYSGQNRRVRWGVTGTAVGATDSNWAWIYNIEQGDTGVEARGAHPTLNAWMCVEWQWDAAGQRIRFYFNDAEATPLHVDTTLPNGTALQIPTFSTLSFGLAKYQNTNADLVFWIDEIAIDTQRIGCGN